MSVRTRADEVVDEMRTALRVADAAVARCVTEVCVEACWGADEYTSAFKRELRRVLLDMQQIRVDVGAE